MAALQLITDYFTPPKTPPSLLSLFTSHNYRTQFRPHRLLPKADSSSSQDQSSLISRRQLITESAIAISISPFAGEGKNGNALAAEEPLSEWERVSLPIDPTDVLLDIAFVPDDPTHVGQIATAIGSQGLSEAAVHDTEPPLTVSYSSK